MGRGKSVAQLEDERGIVVKARTWFYLFKYVLPAVPASPHARC